MLFLRATGRRCERLRSTGGRVCFTLIAIQRGVCNVGYPLRALIEPAAAYSCSVNS